MSYYLTKISELPFEETVNKMISSLTDSGFQIVSELDVRSALKQNTEADFRNYKIFGACNNRVVNKAMLLEDKIGTLLPCNIIVQERQNGKTEVSAINPLEAMSGIDNIKLKILAFEVGEQLKKILHNI